MKKLILTLFLFPNILAYSQKAFAPIGAKWYYRSIESMNPPNEGYVLIESIGDTILGNKSARILKKRQFQTKGSIVDWGFEFLHIDGEKVYRWGNGNYYLLYDFTAEKDTSWLIYSRDPNPCYTDSLGRVRVDSTGVRTINNIVLKSIFLSPDDTSCWTLGTEILQKLGSLHYLFPDYNNICDIMDYPGLVSGLRCYEDPEIGLYKVGNCSCDSLIRYVGINSLSTVADISVYPVPVENIVQIKLNNTMYSHFEFEVSLIDQTGRLLFRNRFKGSEAQIDLSSYENGIYLITINKPNTNTKLFSREIIKK